MSISIIQLIWSEHNRFFTGPEKGVLTKLADHSNLDGRRVFPGFTLLSLSTGYSRRTVIRTIKSLEEKNIFTIVKDDPDNSYNTNSYHLNIELLKQICEKPRKKSVHKSVISPVDKLCINPKDSVTVALGGGVTQTPGGSVTVAPDPSFIDPSLFDPSYNDWDDTLKKVVKAELEKLNVYEFEIVRWLRDYGPQKIYAKMREISQLINERKLFISNFGAYLGTVLEEDKKLNGWPKGGSLERAIYIPTDDVKKTSLSSFNDVLTGMAKMNSNG